jgi:hypothetical protein
MFNDIFDLIYATKHNNISNLSYTFFNFFSKDSYTIKKKFMFYETTNSNIFLGEEQKKEFVDLFNRVQFVYFALTKFVNIIKFKKARIVADEDLCLNKLDIQHKNTMCIYQNNSKYLFSVLDIRKIIYNALTNATRDFFSEPLPIKNPYNNIPFTKSNLYNIYFYIIFNTHYNIELFHKYFELDFDLNSFFNSHEYLLREYAITNYVNRSPINTLHKEIMIMINEYNNKYIKYKIIIHADFPKQKLVHIMRPYLLLQFNSLYSLISNKKHYAYVILNNKLLKFYKFNPAFGRKIVSTSKILNNNDYKAKREIVISFNDNHIKFNNEPNDFLKNHLSFDYLNSIDHIVAYLSDTSLLNRSTFPSIYSNVVDDSEEEEEEEDEEEEDEEEEDEEEDDDEEEEDYTNAYNNVEYEDTNEDTNEDATNEDANENTNDIINDVINDLINDVINDTIM